MMDRRLEDMSKEELVRELEKLLAAERQFAESVKRGDPERLLHDLHVHQVELEMQNRELHEAQGRLEEAAARYADLYDSAPVGYCTLDPTGVIREINRTGALLLGAPRERLVGSPFPSVARLEDSRPFFSHLRRCATEKTRVTSELIFGLDKHVTRVIEIVSDTTFDASGAPRAFRSSLVDISVRKELENKLRLLSEAGERLGSSLDYRTTLEVAARLAVPALADLCMVDMVTEDGAIESADVWFADPQKQAGLASIMEQFASRAGWETPQARVIRSGEPMLLSAVSDQVRDRLAYDELHADALRLADVRSLIVVPLTARGRTFGALTLATAESERRYTSTDLPLARDLAARIAVAVENARLYTEAQSRSRELQLAEAKATGILSTSADAIISIDESQRITSFNDGAERIFGYTKAEATGAPLTRLLPERFRERHRRHVESFAAGEAIARRMGDRRLEIVGLRKNGEEFPADAAISKLAVGGRTILTVALRDMTEQKRVEREQTFLADVGLALANTLDYEETLSKLVELVVRDLADVCIVDIVDVDGALRRKKIVSRDPSLAEICDSLQRIPMGSRDRYLTSSTIQTKRPILIERLSPAMLASVANSDEHLRLLRALDLQSLLVVPLLGHRKLLGALALASTTPSRVYGRADVRLAEEVARRAALSVENASLYQMARRATEARDEVLGIVAHDLRNPLGTILTQAALLQRGGAGPERRSRKPAEVLQRAATRMNRLIEDLLDVTRMESGSLAVEQARVPTAKLISESVETQRPLVAPAGLEFELEVPADLPDVLADHHRVLQVFENIIGNAVKCTMRGGRVTIGAASREGEVLFWVKDTGAGIAQENVPHVFDRLWQQRKADRRGAGLGLAIVKGIVDAHGGRVWVDSQIGVGSTFFFTLPRADVSSSVARTSAIP